MTRKKILYVCGSMNQTTQLHQIAEELADHDAYFTPFYTTGIEEFGRRIGAMSRTIGGKRLVARCERYLRMHELPIDYRGASRDYDLAVLCTDQHVQGNLRGKAVVLVQEGMLDPVNPMFELVKRFPRIPGWLAGTAATGQSRIYRRFCVASEGYRDYFMRHGLDPARLVVTGIPNFDRCERYRENDFPHRDYVLVCTSDARETFKYDNRRRFIERAVEIAAGRPLIFKLHPNERRGRATREINRFAPGALVLHEGSAEEMAANAAAVICQWSTLVYVALALGKEAYSHFDMDELRRLAPVQNGCAARNIAEVCREVLDEAVSGTSPQTTVAAGAGAR